MANRMQPILEKLREDMPEDVKYVTVERQENRNALNVFFLAAEKWRVARGVDYEALHSDHGVRMFWDAASNGGAGVSSAECGRSWIVEIKDTDDEPPKRWAAANDVAQKILLHFKLGQEFWEHKGWAQDGVRTLTLEEQENYAGEILEFIKPLLMKEADAPFPRRLPLPTVPCSECGAGVEVHRHKDPDSISFSGHLEHTPGHTFVRCFKCPPKVGPIKCDSGPVEVTQSEPMRGLSSAIAKRTAEIEAEEALKDPAFLDECARLRDPGFTVPQRKRGCTCGAWVTKETHASHCDLSTAGG